MAFTQALWYRRILAFLIDMVIINTFVIFPLDMINAKYATDALGFEETRALLQTNPEIFHVFFITWTFSILISILYFSMYEYLLEKTPGKAFVGLQVTFPKDKSYVQAFLRNVWLFVLLPLWIVELFYFIFKKERFTEQLTHTKTKAF